MKLFKEKKIKFNYTYIRIDHRHSKNPLKKLCIHKKDINVNNFPKLLKVGILVV